jgi:hypothetical protein
VFPIFKKWAAEKPKERADRLEAVDRAITLAERAAVSVGGAAAAAAFDAAHVGRPAYAYAAADFDAAFAAFTAADAAFTAFASGEGADHADHAAANAANAAFADDADSAFAATIRGAIRRDFELLKVAAEQEKWTDETPVPPEFFGPLWPEGPPKGWPEEEETSEGKELVLELEVPEGVSDEELFEKIAELAGEVDTLHRAYGGRGVTLKTVEVESPADVRKGVLL